MFSNSFELSEPTEGEISIVEQQHDLSAFAPDAEPQHLNGVALINPSIVFSGDFAKTRGGRETKVIGRGFSVRNTMAVFTRVKGRFDGDPEEFSLGLTRGGIWTITMDAGRADIYCSVAIWSHPQLRIANNSPRI